MESSEYHYCPINFKNYFDNSYNLNGTVGSKWQEKVRTRSHEKDLVWEHQWSASETTQMGPTLLGQGQELCLRRQDGINLTHRTPKNFKTEIKVP